MGGLAAGLAAVELAPSDSHKQAKWLCCLAGGLAGYALEPGETVLPIGSTLLAVVGIGALVALFGVVKRHFAQRGVFKHQTALPYRRTP